jgi:ATP adenylyltransferase
MDIKNNLFVPSKIKYVRGDKPKVDCILCSIVKNDPRVQTLEIIRTGKFCVCANLYPYSPGHLMIFPIRHIQDIRSFTNTEALELFKLEKITIDILDKTYKPHGYNIGYNLGKWSGNSIDHVHLHVVPRFINELGFLDIISESRIIVDDPKDNLPRLKRLFQRRLKK